MKTSCLIFALLPLAGSWAGAAEQALVMDGARSSVEIEVKATVDSFTGRLDAFDAAVTVDPATGRVAGARFAFHFADVHTGNGGRDEQMNAWQDTAHHPDGVFVLGSLAPAEGGGFFAKGTLTLHDVAREISFPVVVTHDGARYAIDGDAALDTRDFGLPIIKKFLLLKVEPVVHVRFHLQGVLADAAAAKAKL